MQMRGECVCVCSIYTQVLMEVCSPCDRLQRHTATQSNSPSVSPRRVGLQESGLTRGRPVESAKSTAATLNIVFWLSSKDIKPMEHEKQEMGLSDR